MSRKTSRPVFDRCALILLAALTALLVGQYLLSGYYVAPDTYKLVNFSSRVSPLYPWFLSAVRLLAPQEEAAFAVTALVQDLLLAWCAFSFRSICAVLLLCPTRASFLSVSRSSAFFSFSLFLRTAAA